MVTKPTIKYIASSHTKNFTPRLLKMVFLKSASECKPNNTKRCVVTANKTKNDKETKYIDQNNITVFT